MRFERSWLPAILIILAIFFLGRQLRQLPDGVQLALGVAGGGWLLWTAWQIWRNPTGGAELGAGGRRVQYWRGQRIEVEPPPRNARRSTVPTRQLLIAAFYALLGVSILGVMLVGALARFVH